MIKIPWNSRNTPRNLTENDERTLQHQDRVNISTPIRNWITVHKPTSGKAHRDRQRRRCGRWPNARGSAPRPLGLPGHMRGAWTLVGKARLPIPTLSSELDPPQSAPLLQLRQVTSRQWRLHHSQGPGDHHHALYPTRTYTNSLSTQGVHSSVFYGGLYCSLGIMLHGTGTPTHVHQSSYGHVMPRSPSVCRDAAPCRIWIQSPVFWIRGDEIVLESSSSVSDRAVKSTESWSGHDSVG